MEIYLIRHTTPLIGKDICYGQADIDIVPELFEKEKDFILSKLPSAIDMVYCSPLKRCQQLAQNIIKTLGLQKAVVDKRLMELNFGHWELKRWNDIDQDDLNRWMSDFENSCVPGGESFVVLNRRVMQFMNEITGTTHKVIVIISHAAPLRTIIANALEMPIKNIFKLPMDYGSVTKLSVNGNNCFSKVEFINHIAM